MNEEALQDRGRATDFMSTSGWLIILAAVLSMSTYSLFFVGRHIGVPTPFALIGSACFDGVAMLSAVYALRYAELGMSGTGPRMAVFVFGALSAALNGFHAVVGHEPRFAIVWWIGPPIAAVITLEFHLRWTRRAALMEHGLIAKSFRPLGRRVWTDHPLDAFRTRRAISAERLRQIAAEEAPAYVTHLERQAIERAEQESAHVNAPSAPEAITAGAGPDADALPAPTVPLTEDTARTTGELVRVAMNDGGARTAREIVAWLGDRGRTISEGHARKVRAAIESEDAERRRAAMRAVPEHAAGPGN